MREKGSVIRVVVLLALATSLPSSLSALGLFNKKKDESGPKQSRAERKREKRVRKEEVNPYLHWLDSEVPYIVTPQERAAFLKLTTNAEREQFIEQFWARRNPNPGSPENAFKEEYYRRIAYANEHYSSGVPGWKTDRGRIYIMYGPPDEIESHPMGGQYTPDPGTIPDQGSGAQMTTYPFEDWTYHYIPGVGENVVLEFVDPSGTGEYHLTMNPCEKDAMAYTPGDSTGCQGAVSLGPVWNPNLIFQGPTQPQANGEVEGMSSQYNEFTRLDLYAKIFQPPKVDFNDLRTMVRTTISTQTLPFKVRADFIRLTKYDILTPVTIQIADRDLRFQNQGGIMHATLDVYGQVTTLGGNNAVTPWDQGVDLDIPRHDFETYVNHKAVYQKVLSLAPGLYKLTLVLKDKGDNHIGTTEVRLQVPEIPDARLATSSLILADRIETLPTSEVGSGPWVIGGDSVRPDLDGVFKRDQYLGFYMQVYNLGVDPKTHRPSANINYQILKDGKAILNQTQSAATIPNASEQLTIAKKMPCKYLQPGQYTLRIKVTDNIKKATNEKTAAFTVE